MTLKLSKPERKALIISAAVEVANKQGLINVTFESVAEECKTNPLFPPLEWRTVSHWFKMPELRKAIAHDPRANEEVLASAVVMGHNVPDRTVKEVKLPSGVNVE